jgi:hypothetical protein
MMMNDPTVLEASRVFAEELMEEKTVTDEKIKKAFHRIICRTANAKEINILKSYFDDQLKQFQQKQLDATETLNVGEYPGDKKVDANTTAALMKTISMLYNMEEAIIKT